MDVTVSYLLMLQKCIHSKQKNYKIKILCTYKLMYLGSTLKDFTINNMQKRD